MKKETFSAWCHKATEKIRYGPDRKEVEAELRAHLEDHRDALMGQGLSQDEATQKALEAMGSAEELAKHLAAIHKSFWGYLYSICKCVCITVSVFFLIFCFYRAADYFGPLSYAETYDYWFDTSIDRSGSYTQLYYGEPDVTQTDSGYRCTLTRATAWDLSSDGQMMYFNMTVRVPLLAGKPDIADSFWAEDSLGNYYGTYTEGRAANTLRYTSANLIHTGPLTYVYEGYIRGITCEGAQWIDIHYSRDGRELTWRIDLTGGDSNG